MLDHEQYMVHQCAINNCKMGMRTTVFLSIRTTFLSGCTGEPTKKCKLYFFIQCFRRHVVYIFFGFCVRSANFIVFRERARFYTGRFPFSFHVVRTGDCAFAGWCNILCNKCTRASGIPSLRPTPTITVPSRFQTNSTDTMPRP
jgi:hypothetical protein